MHIYNFGHTAKGTPILAQRYGHQGKKILILGGVHGDEFEGVQGALKIQSVFNTLYSFKLQITVVPQFNIDGILKGTRQNARGVDLNRNLPSRDWDPKAHKAHYAPGPFANSEPENQALTKYLTTEKPHLILSLHSWKPLLNTNGNCTDFANIISSYTGYEVTPDIGYPTPGSLGNYGSNDLGIPVLTYEFEREIDPEKIYSLHVPAILEALKIYEVN